MVRIAALLAAALLWASSAQALVTRYVNTACSAGGTGEISTCSGSTRAFATMSEAEAALPATISDDYVIYLSGTSADTAPVTVSGISDGGGGYRVRFENETLATTSYQTDRYRLEISNATAFYFSNGGNSTIIHLKGVQIKNVATDAGSQFTLRYGGSSANYWVERCFLWRAVSNATYSGGMLQTTSSSNTPNVKVWNSIFIGPTDGSDYAIGGGANTTLSCYNVTQVGMSQGFYRGTTGTGSAVWKNCYSANTSAASYSNGTQTDCASDDSAATAHPNIAYSTSGGTYFQNVTSGSEDLKLASASSGLKDVGTDTTGDSSPLNFSDDINGVTRGTGSNWDIGADEYNEAAGASVRGPAIGGGIGVGIGGGVR